MAGIKLPSTSAATSFLERRGRQIRLLQNHDCYMKTFVKLAFVPRTAAALEIGWLVMAFVGNVGHVGVGSHGTSGVLLVDAAVVAVQVGMARGFNGVPTAVLGYAIPSFPS